MGKENANWSWLHGFVSLGLAIVMIGMPRAAALTEMPHASVTTTVGVNPITCTIQGVAPGDADPYHLNSNPDTVRFSEDVYWVDNRDDESAPNATHYYWMQTEHDSTVRWTDKTVITDGQDSSSDTISIDVPDVYSRDTVTVRLYTSLSGPTGPGSGCPASGWINKTYSFIYP